MAPYLAAAVIAAAGLGLFTPSQASANSTVKGHGFDTCEAPSNAQMDALRSSNLFIGIYVGGSLRTCLQPNLTPSWINHQLAHSWSFIAIYVGSQNPCNKDFGAAQEFSANTTTARSQGIQGARNVVAAANPLGFGPSGILSIDIEAYTGPKSNGKYSIATCQAASRAFIAGYTTELHNEGYSSSVYGSASGSEMADTANSNPPEDYIFFGEADNEADTSSSYIPGSRWSAMKRVKQYVIDRPSTSVPVKRVDLDCANSVLNGQSNVSGAC